MTNSSRRGAVLCALAVAAATVAMPAFADDIEPGPDMAGPMTGVAWDARAEEALTVDDAGTVTAIDVETGESRPVTFTGPVESVQALSLYDELLYIADVGDTESTREFVTVYRVDPSSDITSYRAWDFSYPEGSQNAQALAVSGKGRIYIVTDGDDPGVYRAAPQPSRTGVNQLTRTADAPAGVTDAVFLSDGATLMLRTAKGVELLDAYSWESRALTTYVDGPQSESLTTYGDGRMLVGDATRLRDEPVPDGLTTVTPGPAAEPTPSPTPSPTDGPGTASEPSEPGAAQEESGGVSRRGTILALVGAGIVAVLAGVVVFVVRD